MTSQQRRLFLYQSVPNNGTKNTFKQRNPPTAFILDILFNIFRGRDNSLPVAQRRRSVIRKIIYPRLRASFEIRRAAGKKKNLFFTVFYIIKQTLILVYQLINE